MPQICGTLVRKPPRRVIPAVRQGRFCRETGGFRHRTSTSGPAACLTFGLPRPERTAVRRATVIEAGGCHRRPLRARGEHSGPVRVQQATPAVEARISPEFALAQRAHSPIA